MDISACGGSLLRHIYLERCSRHAPRRDLLDQFFGELIEQAGIDESNII
jgi:hypothetical protein